MRIVITARFTRDWVDRLRAAGAEVDVFDWMGARRLPSPDELAARLERAAVWITEVDQVTGEVLARAPALRVVITCRGNPVNVDVGAATRRGILVCNAPGRNADAVADLTVAFMLCCARKLLDAAHAVSAGEWTRERGAGLYQRLMGFELGGKTAGLVGLGAIGRKVAERLRGFGMRLVACDPYVDPAVAEGLAVRLCPLEDVLRAADFLSIHVHATEETRGMLGAEQLALMKRTAYLINTARAAVVDEGALLDALRNHTIAGAALDVFHREPLRADDPLRALPNVIATPHVGGATTDVVGHQSHIAGEEVLRLLGGEAPRHAVNREVLAALLPGPAAGSE